jgi:hypothetical protein
MSASARRRKSPCSRRDGIIVSLPAALMPSAKGCSKAERSDRHRPLAHLHRGQDLALGIGQVSHRDNQRHDDNQDTSEDLKNRQDVHQPDDSEAINSAMCGLLLVAGFQESFGAFRHHVLADAREIGPVMIDNYRSAPFETASCHRSQALPKGFPGNGRDFNSTDAAKRRIDLLQTFTHLRPEYHRAAYGRGFRRARGGSSSLPSPRPAGNGAWRACCTRPSVLT